MSISPLPPAERAVSPTAAAALEAARRGHRVIPLWPRSKVPAHHGKRDCPRRGPCLDDHVGWEQRATTDPQQLRAWWQARPGLNVGIATGVSGLHVLDLDSADGDAPPERWAGARHGRDVLARIAAEAGAAYPGDTYTVRTPRVIDGWFDAAILCSRRRIPLWRWLAVSTLSPGVLRRAGGSALYSGRESLR